ncbi:ty3-gypsy retrotransposon protein [Cucumis melo var. makuwa]|uniref:Ty3-gypsy retrotransposon protein n=1 Tax=Cucumis melo var. makuwa TaxID=1194695 RepID=A0A5D3E3S6_CUCMM|nr:ty3-gypsy retrotransposon protein [Cucumis melo var. makuwa]TYK30458.1 ty3-gypsy retrotransposon protein [Cucumis melo var. makuwa]
MRTRETAESSQTPVVKATDKGKNVVQENQPQQQSVSVASLSVQQLQDMITNSIRAQYGGSSQSTFMYSKSYTKRIDNLRMPLGYQPPKFQQFDRKTTQSNISPTSSKRVRMQDQEETNLSGNSFEA